MVKYGTYLTFLVREEFLKENYSFSAKDLALHLDQQADITLVRRCRRALKELEDIGFLTATWERVPGHPHLTIKKYKKQDGEGQKFS